MPDSTASAPSPDQSSASSNDDEDPMMALWNQLTGDDGQPDDSQKSQKSSVNQMDMDSFGEQSMSFNQSQPGGSSFGSSGGGSGAELGEVAEVAEEVAPLLLL